jgi:hypothetical protein
MQELAAKRFDAKVAALKAALKDKVRDGLHVFSLQTTDAFVPEAVWAEIAHRAGLLSAGDARANMIHASHWEGGLCCHTFGIACGHYESEQHPPIG